MKHCLLLCAAVCLLVGVCRAADQRLGALLPGDRVVTSEDDAAALAYAHAMSDTLQQPNSLTLFGSDLYRMTVIDGPDGWLDWQVLAVSGQSSVGVWAYWDYAVMNADGALDEDQVADFGASDYGQFAWILDPDGNYRVPQEWQDGDHFSNSGPDDALACWFNGWQWCPGETTVDDNVIDAVDTGYSGGDVVGNCGEYGYFPIEWAVSDDRRQVSYMIDWRPSGNAPPSPPTFLEAENVNADIRIRPVADVAIVWDGGVQGTLCAPDGSPLASLGNGPLDTPVETTAGAYFDYSFTDWCPGVYGTMSVYLDNPWLYGRERQPRWFQVPSALEVANTVNAAIAGDQSRYLKYEVDGIVQAARDDLGAHVQSARDDLGAAVAGSTNLLTPALTGQFLCPVTSPDTNGITTLAWSNSPFVSVQNTNATFLVLPPVPATGQVETLYFDCLATNALFFTKPVVWASAPPSGKGLYQLFGNPLATNAWRGWAVPETRLPVAYTQFAYALPRGTLSNGLFASPVGVTLGNGATSNGLPAMVAVRCMEQTQTNWTAIALSRTNLYAGNVYLPFGCLRVAFSNSADGAVSAMPAFAVDSRYHLEFGSTGAYVDLTSGGGWGQCDGYPAYAAWYFAGILSDGSWGGTGAFVDNMGSSAPGFARTCFRAGTWGNGTGSGCFRSPAITGLISRVILFIKSTTYPSAHGVVEYCPLTSNWTAQVSWTPLPDAVITNVTWQWLNFAVNRTNGYLRVRSTPVIGNAGAFSVAYLEIQ